MKCLRMVLAAMLPVLLMASAASAITVHDVLRQAFDPSINDVLATYGQNGHYLTYAPIDPATHLFDPAGISQRDGTWQNNPPWLDFHLDQGGGGGGTGPFGPGSNQVSYTLASTGNAPSSFDFSVLFYDPTYDPATADPTNVVQVVLSGSDGTLVDSDKGNEAFVTAGELRGGTMLTWNIEAGAGVDVTVTVNSIGTYAAGFFLDNLVGGHTPEPASALLLLGGAMVPLFRRWRRG